MKLNKLLLSGLVAGLLGAYLTTNHQKEPLNYNGKIKNATVVYRDGIEASSDTMEIFYNDKQSVDTMFQKSLPMVEIFNDYDHNGTIGNHAKDMYALFSESPVKPEDVDPVFPEDTTSYLLNFPSLALNTGWKANVRYKSRTVCTNNMFNYNDEVARSGNTKEDKRFVEEVMKVATKKYKDCKLLIIKDITN